MTIATFPQTSLGAAAAAVVDRLAPGGVQRIQCPDDATWHALRRQDITASVAAALLGAADPEDQHAYATPYKLYLLATGAIEPEPIDEEGPVLRGWLMEEPAVRLLRRRNPSWIVRHNAGDARVYYRDPAARIGCTPDAIVNDPQRGIGIVQIKSVEASIFRRKWKNDDGDFEPPLWIAVQAIVEATLVGASWAAVAPIVVGHGVEMPLIEVPIKAGIMVRLRAAVAEFWRRVAEKRPYDPDFRRDGELIAQLYDDPDPGVIVDLSSHPRIVEIVAQREALKEREADGKAAEKERKTLDAHIIFTLGNAESGRLPDGRIITTKATRRAGYEVAPTSFRTVRIKRA
ncbi:YqaJ viral recombinase family protein [Methylosinus sp. Ce-a6]|uniref:YqaJ viral recombinase family protein n=1 Tax=Methylosinus sp. Ce-a6 TaxID=2172005 RepID=UPI0013571B26|nr:YqaJ viral recombinase family protein [Methylosinus sp. Ce-a6]